MKVRAILCVAIFLVLSGPVLGQETASSDTTSGAVVLSISPAVRVVEQSAGLPMRYSITNGSGAEQMVLAATLGEETVMPVVWKVTDASGAVVLETVLAEGLTAKNLSAEGEGRFLSGEEVLAPKDKWPLGTLRIEGFINASRSDSEQLFGVTARSVQVEVKEDGWKEATYKRCAEGLEKVLRAKFGTMAFEFPEARDLSVLTYESTPDWVTGRFKLVREYLEIDDKAKTARLRKKDGAFEFTAGDPLARAGVPCDVRGYIEGGLVALDFKQTVDTNKWFVERLPVVEEEIIKAIRDYGFEKAVEIVTKDASPDGRELPSTDSILKGGRPYEKEELPLVQ